MAVKLNRKLLGEIEYFDTLNEGDKKWLYHFVMGTTYGSTKQLKKILPDDAAEIIAADCTNDRNVYRRDMMNKWDQRKEVTPEKNNSENYHIQFQEGQYMNTFEDALIEAIDAEKRGVPNSFRSYGNNDAIAVGNDVVICVEGHALQNRLGKVIAKRRGQYLVQVQTTKGDVSVYLSAHELARVNQMRSAM